MWIKTTAEFNESKIDGIEKLEHGYFTFDLSEVMAFNESTAGNTTIWFKAGITYTVDIKFKTFQEIHEHYLQYPADNDYMSFINKEIEYNMND